MKDFREATQVTPECKRAVHSLWEGGPPCCVWFQPELVKISGRPLTHPGNRETITVLASLPPARSRLHAR